MSNKNILLKIKKIALKIDHDISFGGKSKGNRHLFRVVEIAEFLAKKTGADLFVVTTAAFLHDTALPFGDDNNYFKNKEIVIDLLKDFDIEKKDIEKIAECVASNEGTIRPKTLEAKIVHDADVLEKSGILGMIRHTWKLVNLNKISIDNVIEHLEWRANQLQTNLAKELFLKIDVKLSKKRAREIITIIIELVNRGLITEDIATLLYEQLETEEVAKLKSQIGLIYLKKA